MICNSPFIQCVEQRPCNEKSANHQKTIHGQPSRLRNHAPRIFHPLWPAKENSYVITYNCLKQTSLPTLKTSALLISGLAANIILAWAKTTQMIESARIPLRHSNLPEGFSVRLNKIAPLVNTEKAIMQARRCDSGFFNNYIAFI